MWLLAGGSALVSASLTYMMTRGTLQPAIGRIRDGVSRAANVAKSRFRQDRDDTGFEQSPAVHNSAFEDYRSATLRQLHNDESDFQSFLETLRGARDREEFDRFMADRRNRAD